MNEENLKLLRELTCLAGPPSYENRVIRYMKTELEAVSDEVLQDRLGGTIGVKYSKAPDAPRVMLAGHMDEIAFMISGIDADGLLRFVPLGGWWPLTMFRQRVVIMGEDGDDFAGVITSRAIRQALSDDQKNRALKIEEMRIDCGASSREEAISFGILPGTYAVPQSEFVELKGGNRLLSKAFDNRYGCALAIALMRAVKDIDLPCHLYAGATVQEEGGVRGAAAVAALVKPDVFFAADSSDARDIAGADELSRLGEGVMIRFYDKRMRPNRSLRNFTRAVAEEEKITYQHFYSYGSTDASVVQLYDVGVPSMVIGMPSRYNHSHSVIMDKRDFDASLELMVAMVQRIDRRQYEKFLEF